MSMRDGLNKWIQSSKQGINPDLIQKTCNTFGLKGDEADACILIATEFDQGSITDAQFIAGLSGLCHKTPDEVGKILLSLGKTTQSEPQKTSKRYEYRVHLPTMNDKIWELTTRDENPDLPTDSPFYITIQSIAASEHNRYLPVNPNDPAWPPILAELEKQTRRLNV